jgi:hypothetical protein
VSEQPKTLTAFIDAAKAAVANEIASVRREGGRERELRDAEHRALIAELQLTIARAPDVERKLTMRIRTLEGRLKKLEEAK